jgi:predicted ATPase
MAIKKIKISNFKSFKDLEIELGKFNVIIGPNASGKSNFIEVFKFLKDIVNHGLENAISIQGGIEYLRNINIGSSENLSLEVVLEREFRFGVRTKEKGLIGIKNYETTYKLALKFKRRGQRFEIVEDKITQKVNFYQLEKKDGKIKEKKKLGKGEIVCSLTKGKVNVELNIPKDIGIKKEDIIPRFLEEVKLESKTLSIEHPPLSIFHQNILNFFSDRFSIYDFDPKLPKKATPITGKAVLEEDGSNLAIVLKNILGNKDLKRKFSNLVKDLLPFVDDLSIEKFADKSLLFKIREVYTKKLYLPASLISDGTINITALIIALYFDKKQLTIIEEPERNIHPYLISKVVDMMKDVSQKKQIIVTTHNPEMVKHAGVENILLISRDKEGFSVIFRPYKNETVKTFLKNELGIEELYVHNLLGL